MDAGVALELFIAINADADYPICIEEIVSDDDSTMRSHLQLALYDPSNTAAVQTYSHLSSL